MSARTSKSAAFLAFTLALLVLATACKDKRGVKVGDTAPAISATDIRGNPITLSKLKGKTVVVCFWTDSCCGDRLKQLEPIYSRNKDRGFELIAINEMDTAEKIRSYAARNRLTFTMLSDERSMLFKQYDVVGLPTLLILDKEGVIREKIQGEMQTAKLEKLIERHIN